MADATLLVWAVDTKNDFSDKGIRYALRQIIRSSENGTPFVSGTTIAPWEAQPFVGLNTAAGIGPDCFADGIVVSGGYNLVRDPAEPVCADAFTQPGDITKISPGIQRLADNGGPTRTIALRKHSKAIDHAGSDAPELDQRGVRRRVKGDRKPDIGAFERR